MGIVIGIALVLGIIWGVSRAIAGAEVSRLRNALQLATKQAADSGAEVHMLRCTLDTYESALRARDHHIDMLVEQVADLQASGKARHLTPEEAIGDVLPLPVREALFGKTVAPAGAVIAAAGIEGEDDGAFIVAPALGAMLLHRVN